MDDLDDLSEMEQNWNLTVTEENVNISQQRGVVELLRLSAWNYGSANFWILVMFCPLLLCFIISYIVHWIHVMKKLQLMRREQGGQLLDRQHSKVTALLSIRGLERQNTTFLWQMAEDVEAHNYKHSDKKGYLHL